MLKSGEHILRLCAASLNLDNRLFALEEDGTRYRACPRLLELLALQLRRVYALGCTVLQYLRAALLDCGGFFAQSSRLWTHDY